MPTRFHAGVFYGYLRPPFGENLLAKLVTAPFLHTARMPASKTTEWKLFW
jgi:hypothetical protein